MFSSSSKWVSNSFNALYALGKTSFEYLLKPELLVYDVVNTNLYQYVFNPEDFFGSLEKKALEQKGTVGVNIVNLGLMGKVGYVVLHSKMEAKKLIDLTDNQPEGRAPLFPFHYFTSSPIFFAHTTQNALQQRKALVRFFNREKLIDAAKIYTMRELHNTEKKEMPDGLAYTYRQTKTEMNTLESMKRIVIQTALNVVLGIETIPKELVEACTAFEDIGTSRLSHFRHFISLSSKARRARDAYTKSLKLLWSVHLPVVQAQLKDSKDPENENLIIWHIIQLIKNEYPECINNQKKLKKILQDLTSQQIMKYLNHENIRALPSLVLATNNLAHTLDIFFRTISTTSGWQLKLRKECATGMRSTRDFSQGNYPYLYGFFQESVRFHQSNQGGLTRYTAQEIKEFNIPKNTTLFINFNYAQKDPRKWPNSGLLDPARWLKDRQNLLLDTPSPFSEGSRACPAASVLVDSVFSTTVATVLTNVTLSASNTEKEKEDIVLMRPIFS